MEMDPLSTAVSTNDVKSVQELYSSSRNQELVRLAVVSGSRSVLELLLIEASLETVEIALLLAVKKGDLSMVKMLNETLFSIHGRHIPWEAMVVALEREDTDIIRYSAAYIRDDYYGKLLQHVAESSKNNLLNVKDMTKRMYQERQIEAGVIGDFLSRTYRNEEYTILIAVLSAIYELLGEEKERFSLDLHFILADESQKTLVLEKYLVEHIKIDPFLLARSYQNMCLDVSVPLLYLLQYSDWNSSRWRKLLHYYDPPVTAILRGDVGALVSRYL